MNPNRRLRVERLERRAIPSALAPVALVASADGSRLAVKDGEAEALATPADATPPSRVPAAAAIEESRAPDAEAVVTPPANVATLDALFTTIGRSTRRSLEGD